MKSWKKPEAIGQQFVANDYVSACSITVKCDYRTGESIRNGGLVIPDDIEYTDVIPVGNSIS